MSVASHSQPPGACLNAGMEVSMLRCMQIENNVAAKLCQYNMHYIEKFQSLTVQSSEQDARR